MQTVLDDNERKDIKSYLLEHGAEQSKKDTSLPMFGFDALPTEERPASVRFGSDDKSKTELETNTKMVDYKEEITKIIKQYNPAKLGNIDILLNGK